MSPVTPVTEEKRAFRISPDAKPVDDSDDDFETMSEDKEENEAITPLNKALLKINSELRKMEANASTLQNTLHQCESKSNP